MANLVSWHCTKVGDEEVNNLTESLETDAILVCAGGLLSSGLPNAWVQARLELCAKLYSAKPQPILCLGGGTYHKPPILNKFNFVIHESTSCATSLMKMGLPAKDILKEWGSYDTIGNAWFGFVNYVIPFGWKNIVVVTSDFHMPRVQKLFNWVKSLFNLDCVITFVPSPDNMDDEILELRSAREKSSCNNIDILATRITTPKDFAKWLYTEHNAYAVSEVVTQDTTMKNKTLQKSY